MASLSILLALSGSQPSMFAMEAAFRLARERQAQICVQHVVDTHAAGRLLQTSEPGLIGSGLYVDAYETLLQSLRALAVKLMDKCESVNRDVSAEYVIDEGCPVEEIARRAGDYDLIIVGHSFSPRNSIARNSMKSTNGYAYGLIEDLANKCDTPMLIVQDRVASWDEMLILSSPEHFESRYVLDCVALAKTIGLEPRLVFVSAASSDQESESFISHVRKAHPNLQEMPIEFNFVRGESAERRLSLWQAPGVCPVMSVGEKALVVVPVRAFDESRMTLFGVRPDELISHLDLSSLVMWPERGSARRSVNSQERQLPDAKRRTGGGEIAQCARANVNNSARRWLRSLPSYPKQAL